MKTNSYSLALTAVLLIISMISYAQPNSSDDVGEKLKEEYSKLKNPEISLERFIELNRHVYASQPNFNSKVAALAAPQDPYCSKVRPYCDNGTFESGLDQNKYTGAYGFWYSGLYPDPFTLTYGFSSGILSQSSSHQTIVNKANGNDPTTGISVVPPNGGNQSLRLGNTADGYGTEILAKTIIVDPAETILNFYYAVVFQDPGHPRDDQPAFSVRAYDCASGMELQNVCDLGNGSNIAVSDAQNPFFKSANFGTIAYRDWSRAQINLAAHVGKKVTIVFTNKDCGQGAHWGYTYLDNLFSTRCPIDPPPPPPSEGSITLNSKNINCGIGKICTNYTLPFVTTNGTTTKGSINISLDIFQDNVLVKTINSATLTQGTSYCFDINPATIGINISKGGFDYVVTGNFTLAGFPLAPIKVGNPPQGQISGVNNDYLQNCPITGNDYYSKPSGDLHTLATWGTNPDGSGPPPTDFGAGKTFHLANRPSIYNMTANWSVAGTIDIPSGSELRINAFTLSEASLIGTGRLYGTTSSNLVVAGTAGGNTPISFAPGGNNLNNLTVNRTGTSASATVSAPLNIYGVLTLTSGALNTGNNITLKSTVANTARVAPITGGSIVGNVTVERYIPARRAWRIMSAPVGGSQTINAAWQEGATTSSGNPNPNPGYGTHITEGSAANGFDHNPKIAMMSIKRYVSATDTWTPLSNTNSTPVNSEAYLLFVRGHRATPLGYNTVSPTNTTLRATGPLKTGNQTFPVSATGFTAIPNPFASPINFATITRTNVQNNFYLWDPKLGGTNGVGGYVLLSANGSGGYNITPTPASPESQFIQSGQGFLVHSTGVAGSITIKESDKSATPATNVFRSSNTTVGLRTTLKIVDGDNAESVVDEVYAIYSRSFSNKVDGMDPVKLANINENLGIAREGETLMIERRNEVAGADTIPLKLWNTSTKERYLLQINPENLSASTVTSAYLEDNYLHSRTPISLTDVTRVSFDVNGSESAANPTRFRIILQGKGTLTPNVDGVKNSIRLLQNPIDGRKVTIQMIDQPEGTYTVGLVNAIGQMVYKGQVKHAGGSSTHTLQLTSRLVKGMYQLRITNEGAKIQLALPILSN